LQAMGAVKPVPTAESRLERALREAECKGGELQSCSDEQVRAAVRDAGGR
jgi:hypothetical protein